MMNGDLVKRLREEAIRADSGNEISESLYHDILQAADAIEKLKKKLYFQDITTAQILEMYMPFFIPKWIPVTERLPPVEKEVYVTNGEYIARANLLDAVFPGDKPCWSYSGLGKITHWCEQIPLPQQPKEE